jgi:hypothetical protein
MALDSPSLLDANISSTSGDWTGAPSVTSPRVEIDTKKLRATVRAINSVDQIYAICEAMFDPSSERNKKNGIIAKQANDAPPFPHDEHKQKGQKFRHNFSTGAQSSVIRQAVGSPVRMLNQAQYLTSAGLDEHDDPEGVKTEAYRRKFTKVMRSWDGWDSHINNVSGEDCTYGYNAVVVDDPDDWRPEECRQDDFGVPDNTKQFAGETQFFGRRKSILINKFIDTLADVEAADAAGYIIDNCVAELNECMPQDRTEGSTTQVASSRTLVDLVRDGNAGAAHDPRARTIDVYILLATEHDGKVSKFIVAQKGRRLLYECYDEFDKLSDIITFYSLEPAGSLYSSKGIGRITVNMAKSLERSRNKRCDSTYMGGLVWFKTKQGMSAVQMKVFDLFGIMGSEAEIQPEAVPTNHEAWDSMEERLTAWIEQSVGAYIPRKDPAPGTTTGQKKTAHEVALEAQRETQQKAEWLERFFTQFGHEMSIVAKRLGNPDTKDQVAKDFQKDLEENDDITPDLLKKLVEQPQGMVIADLTQMRTQTLIQMAPILKQSRFIDQFKLEHELSMRVLGKELTDRLMFKNGIDPNDEAKQVRDQIHEIAAIKTGESMNVVDDDNHKIHTRYLRSDLERGEPKMLQEAAAGTLNPSTLDNWATLIKHGDAHVAKWEAQLKGTGRRSRRRLYADPQEVAELQQHKAGLKQSQDRHDQALKLMLAHKARADQAQAQGHPQAGIQAPPQGVPGPTASGGQRGDGKPPERTWGGMTERVLTAWVGQYELLTPNIRAQLEKISGLQPDPVSSNGQQPVLTQGQERPKPEEQPQPTQ